MIVSLEPSNTAPSRIVKVYTYKNCVLLRILDPYAIIQFNENIRRSRHYCFQLRFTKLLIETLRNIQSDQLFRRPVAAKRATVLTAVSGIDDNGVKSPSRVFHPASAHTCARSQRRD